MDLSLDEKNELMTVGIKENSVLWKKYISYRKQNIEHIKACNNIKKEYNEMSESGKIIYAEYVYQKGYDH